MEEFVTHVREITGFRFEHVNGDVTERAPCSLIEANSFLLDSINKKNPVKKVLSIIGGQSQS